MRKTFGSIDPLNVKVWNFDAESKLMGLHGRFNEETDLITQLGVVELDDSIDDSVCFNGTVVKYCKQKGTIEIGTGACMNQEIDEETSSGEPPLVQIIIVTALVLFFFAILITKKFRLDELEEEIEREVNSLPDIT